MNDTQLVYSVRGTAWDDMGSVHRFYATRSNGTVGYANTAGGMLSPQRRERQRVRVDC